METSIPLHEYEALLALYNATQGKEWHNQKGWAEATEAQATDGQEELPSPCAWYGVTCSKGHITGLALKENHLSGTIPETLKDLVELTHLDLSGNDLRGSIPERLGSLKELTILNLADNNLRGRIPPRLGILLKLQELDLHNNQLNGEIPLAIGDLVRLVRLNLSNNEFSGNVPPTFGNLDNLTTLDISHNPLSGTLPPTLPRMKTLEAFLFNETQITEPTDSEFLDWLKGLIHVERSGLVAAEIVRAREGGKNTWLAPVAGIGIAGVLGVTGLITTLFVGLIPGILIAIAGVVGGGLAFRQLKALPPSSDKSLSALPGISPGEITIERLQKQMRYHVTSIQGQFPQDIVTLVEDIERLISTILPSIEDITSGNQDVYAIRQTITEYLPEALNNYRILPKDYANNQPLQEGKTARELLREQLIVLKDELEAIAGRLSKDNAQQLMVHGRFLEDKFDKPDDKDSWL